MPGPASLDPNRGGLVKFAMSPKFLYTADMFTPFGKAIQNVYSA